MMKRKQNKPRNEDKKRLKVLIEEYTGINFIDTPAAFKEHKTPYQFPEEEVSANVSQPVYPEDDQDRLFVALPIPEHVQRQVYERLQTFLTDNDSSNVVWQKGIMMHMTISFIGKASRAEVMEQLAGFSNQRFKISLSKFSHRGTAKLRLMTSPNEELLSFTQGVIERTGKGDITRFKGHISLGVLQDGDQAWVDKFMQHVELIDLTDISWVPKELCLFSSMKRPYKILHRIELKRNPVLNSVVKSPELTEKPLGKRAIGSSVELVYTEEQQERLER